MWELKRFLCAFSVLVAFIDGKGHMPKEDGIKLDAEIKLVKEEISPETRHAIKTERDSKVQSGSSHSYSYKSESSYSYSYSYSSLSSAGSSAYYYAYGYSASGYQPGYSGSASGEYHSQGKTSANSWVEQICDLLPFRSAYVGNRCFFTISAEYLKSMNVDQDIFIKSQFNEDFMQSVNLELRLAHVDKIQIYKEILSANILSVGTAPQNEKLGKNYNVATYFNNGTVISNGEAKEKSSDGFLYEFTETHTCPERYTRFSGNCYKFITKPKNYNEALENCEKMNANLPTINNDEENRFVASLVQGQSTWLSTYWPRGSDDWEISVPQTNFQPLAPKYYRWLNFKNDSNSRHAVLFGTKNSPHFWFGNWANMDGKQTKQPYVCVTDLINGVYPDIVEPYPAGSNVSVIVSSPNTSAFIPPECCTAALPIVSEEVTTPLQSKDENVNDQATLPSIDTPSPQTPALVNLTDNFVELYRHICKMGTCEWYHAYSSSAKVKMPCCETEGFIAEIVGEDSYNDIKRPCPGLMPLYAYYADDKGGQFILAEKPEDLKKYDDDTLYFKPQKNLGYCAPKQGYCGATIPIYEISLTTNYKKDNFYSTLDDEIAWVVTTNNDYKGLSNGIVCWAWSHENSTNTLTNTLKNATLPKCDSTGRDLEATSKKPVELNIVGTVRSPKPDKDIPPIVCGPKAEVKMTDGNQGCVCSAGYIGNATDMINGCIPIVTCSALSCGPNAVCKVENNTILCQCKLGTSGNPFDMKDGCRTFVVTASMWGDPHYTTFDGQKFDWHGICPYIYSMNCKPGNIAPYEDFKVKARNTNIWADEKGIKRRIAVSRVVEVEVEFPDVVIHVDANYKLYVDGQPQPYDYYFPNASFNKISVVNQPGVVTITRNDGIVIVLKEMYLGITIPDVPQLQGADKICGLSGNRDKNCQNDLMMRNGTVMPTNEVCKTIVGYAPAIQAGDSWLIPKTEFLNTPGAELETCIAGKLKSDVGSATCEGDKLGRSLELCQPILDAKNGKGVFSACQPLGNYIYKMHESCGFDVCLLPTVKCQSFATFAQKCQAEVPFVKLGEWRKELGCEDGQNRCPPNSKFSSCASPCASSCQKCKTEFAGGKVCWGAPGKIANCIYQTQKVCTGNDCRWVNNKVCPPTEPNVCVDICIEGCICDSGFVVDKSEGFKCVPLNMCPDDSFLAGGEVTRDTGLSKLRKVVWQPQFRGFERVPWSLCGHQLSSSKQPDQNSCLQQTTNDSLGFQYNRKTQDCVIWDQVYGICPLPLFADTKFQSDESYFYIKSDQTSDLTVLLKKIITYGKATKPPPNVKITCPTLNNSPAPNRCYMVTSPLYWDDANSLCKSYGGNLVSIHSEEEIAYIYNFFANLSNSGGNGWHWIGLTDPSGKYTLDTYQWTDGTPMDYKRWIKGMPAGPFQELKLGGAMYNMKSDPLTDEKYKSRWTSAIANQYLRAICEVKRNDIVWQANFQAGFENVPWTLCGRQHSATKQTDVNSCRQKTTDQALGFQYNPQTRDCVVWDQVYGICPLPITDLESYFYIKSDQTSDLTVLLKKVIEYGKATKPPSNVKISCPTLNDSPEPNRCYIVTSPLYWDDAKNLCKSYGGSLVSIHSDVENDYIYNIFDAIKNGGGNAWQWIGLTDPSGKYTADTYQWSDGSPMDFKKWSPSNPGRPWWTTFHGLKMCGAMYNYKSDPNPLDNPYKSKWISAVCNTVLRSICEVKK